MFEDASNFQQYLTNPSALASAAIKEIEKRLGGDRIIADPNSPACHLLEFGSSVTANAIRSIEDRMPQIYPFRAETMDDLFHHMSDYDYLSMNASPSSLTINVIYNAKYLYENALDYTSQLRKITIPRTTKFTIGRYTFGIYYPIDILINTYTKSFTTVYDTTEENPLHILSSNIVNNSTETYEGLEYLTLSFPIYQFSRSVVTETVNATTSFSKKYTYNNEFYACRIFSISNGIRTELGQTQSALVYDTQRPTALVQILSDERSIRITIPQVYLTEKSIGTKLQIEIFTTLGTLEVQSTNLASAAIQIKYGDDNDTTITKYSSIFKGYPFSHIVRLASNISGGTSPISFNTLRDRVINDRLYSKAPITEAEIEDYLNDHNFTVTKFKDNVTDRIYKAYRVLEDSDGKIIASCIAKLEIAANYPSIYETCIEQSDGSFTILPSTWYRYNNDTNCVLPLTLSESQAILNRGKSAFVQELNSNRYLKTPFHLRVDTTDYYPKVVSFNLMTPTVTDMKFETENYDLTYKMRTYNCAITHEGDGVSGYLLRMLVTKSTDLNNVDRSNLIVYLTTMTKDGYVIGGQASFEQSLGNSGDIYSLKLETNYHVTEDERISITNLQGDNTLSENTIDMSNKFNLIFLIKRTAIRGEYADAPSEVTEGVPAQLLNDYVGMSRQSMTLNLGYSLANIIKNDIEITSTAKQYAVYEEDEPRVYDADVYERDADGKLIYTVDDDSGTIQLVKLYSAGDPVKDASGSIVYKHRRGDIKYDTYGNPVIASDREKRYYVDCMFIDAKIFASERTAERNFVTDLYSKLEGYFKILTELQTQLLERTMIYFYCSKSTGLATFNIGNNISIIDNVEMSFKINCYVPSYVKRDEAIQQTIIDKTCSAIETAIKSSEISMLDIFKDVLSKLSGYVDHFDLLGINGNTELQTFAIVDSDARPSIRRKLVLTDDNVITLENDIDINFIALVDNTAETTSVEV